MISQLTLHHLRFTVQVETTIVMDAFKGSALRGAWQSHLRTLYCAQREPADALHQAMCPVCFLLSRETGSGDDRRPYTFVPPLTPQTQFEPGERFQFGMSLFGNSVQFLPYLVLAINQMGQQQGLGHPVHPSTRSHQEPAATPPDDRSRPRAGRLRRGTYRLISIEESDPLSGECRTLLVEGGHTVHMPTLAVGAEQIVRKSEQLLSQLAADPCLALEFLTPTRIVQAGRLVHQPQLAPVLARILDRVSALGQQFADQPALPRTEKVRLLALADQVQLAEDTTHWWDVHGRSTRLQREQPLGGFVGRAIYRSDALEIWADLVPWLLWGQCVQVGKNVVKGCGVMAVCRP